jgi:hypothetical protein
MTRCKIAMFSGALPRKGCQFISLSPVELLTEVYPGWPVIPYEESTIFTTARGDPGMDKSIMLCKF